MCYLIRYDNYNREPPDGQIGEPEKCECACHREEEDDYEQ